MDLFLFLLIFFVPLFGFTLGAFFLDSISYAMSELWERAVPALRRVFKRDRPVIGYKLVELVDGKFMQPGRGSARNIFSSEKIQADVSQDSVLESASALKRQFLAEILLYGDLEQSDYDYRSRDHRVLQIVALKHQPIRGLFSKARELEDLQPLLDELQEKSGSVQPLRYVQSLEDFEPTVIEPGWRARRRAWRLRDYFATTKMFYAADDLTVAPGLQPVTSSGAAISGTVQKRPRRRRTKGFETLIAEVQTRIPETAGRSLQKTLKILLGELSELQGRLTESEVSQGARLLEAKYGPSVRRLIELSSRDYYGSFFSDPKRWSDPQRMALQVELSAVTLVKELTEDLKGLNSPRELEFQLSVRSLVGADSQPRSLEEPSVNAVLGKDRAERPDFQGDLESLREALTTEEAALLEEQSRPKSLKQMLLG